MFQDRIDAGNQLAEKLKYYAGTAAVVMAVPRGGVPVAYAVAKRLDLTLDLLFAKKIGHPLNREYAIGAVSLTDSFILPHRGISPRYIKSETDAIRRRIKSMQLKYTESGQLQRLKDKTVIVVDDGMATGNTLLSTVNMLRKEQPAKIVVAVPVASRESASHLAPAVDELVCVLLPDEFFGVGGFYEDFHQVTDEEVMRYLHQVQKTVASAPGRRNDIEHLAE